MSPEDLCINFYTASCEVYKTGSSSNVQLVNVLTCCAHSVHKCAQFRIICCGKEAKPPPPSSSETYCLHASILYGECKPTLSDWQLGSGFWGQSWEQRSRKGGDRRKEEILGDMCAFLPLWSWFHRLHNESHFILLTCAGEMAGCWFLWGTGNWSGMPQHPRKNWTRYTSAAQGWLDGSKQITGVLVSQVSCETARSRPMKDSVSEK